MPVLTRRQLVLAGLALPVVAARADARWDGILAEARGQTVYFNAWAGSPQINGYIAWAGEQAAARFGITLKHVKVAETSEVVRRVRDEVKAGKADGSTDLVWINGANFLTMKSEGLLFGPFAEALPNFALVDVAGKPTTRIDFAVPTEGYESPWGMAQLTFFGDGSKIARPPQSMAELFAFASAHEGAVSYPAPPDFHGTTFVKQVLVETVGDRTVLASPVDRTGFDTAAAPAFAFLDRLHPLLWRAGKQFPPSQAQMAQMVADGELLIGLTFNPSEPANLVAAGTLPGTTTAWQHRGGTIGNTHFVAIPVNAQAKPAAQVVADFLLSPEAQARKADLKVWGDPTVLDLAKLSPSERGLFSSGAAPGAVVHPAPAIPEPHASWVPFIEAAWRERYGA